MWDQYSRARIPGLSANYDGQRRCGLLPRDRQAARPISPHDDDASSNVDSTEFLSAVGTFSAALAAFASVGIIALRQETPSSGPAVILLGWVAGVSMQIVAGAMARFRGKAIGIGQ